MELRNESAQTDSEHLQRHEIRCFSHFKLQPTTEDLATSGRKKREISPQCCLRVIYEYFSILKF